TILIGFLLSLAAGVGLALLLDHLDNTVKTAEDVERYAQLPALSVIPSLSSRRSRRQMSNGEKKFAELARGETASLKTEALVALETRSSADYQPLTAAPTYAARGRLQPPTSAFRAPPAANPAK